MTVRHGMLQQEKVAIQRMRGAVSHHGDVLLLATVTPMVT